MTTVGTSTDKIKCSYLLGERSTQCPSLCYCSKFTMRDVFGRPYVHSLSLGKLYVLLVQMASVVFT